MASIFSSRFLCFKKEITENYWKYGTKKYGNYHISSYKLNILKGFNALIFFPVPKCTVINFRPKTKVLNIKKIQNLEKINIYFQVKEKMINKNMKIIQ